MSKEIRSPRPYTSEAECLQYHSQLFSTFAAGKTKSIKWRKWQLKQMWWMLVDNEKAIAEALAADLGRHEFEALTSDLHGLKTDILEHLNHVEEWAADEPVASAGFLMGTLGKARIRKEPLGVVLVIGAWNFPFLLTLQPVIAAITAGCCVVVKPSELSVASQNLMQDLVGRYLDPEAIRLVTGGPQETTKLLELKFNHIFFTGSTKVAKFVAAAAAKHLTPTVLELGDLPVGESRFCRSRGS
ncbi:aldehyde dehydrogenase (NAD+) [Fusarium oxysporum f. sp. lycopersici 4287]|uniref:Beta-apo-4'-carotenal oxygenase n=1 Tax=Fusarium oxysporum f. sp. lycopersici (strain 4287 / CBS 123668 / FGSC 9935 / NRRL 34936) TaxID=426428 RepID=A0A0J9WIH0_FUSO4|nr:aldehyde dehydrogenase (NAD+) [Fusarium oxysporum f. sp. lycopersici 4287]KNA98516.1 aldehyde dehydrogenase (NAD+) [Fusarium oxysporum f. sp. lycopersici 4287]